MTSLAGDTFGRFVAVLEAALDDHEVDGEALAARLHLSRFHVDRLVRAAAGEPPAAMRRRVLLERAAYRLATTPHDVLRIAVEAGYSSNEAFTRAFARAFGSRRRGGGRGRRRTDSRHPATCTSSHQEPCGSPRTGRFPAWTY